MRVEFTKEQKVNDKLYKTGEEANFSKSVALEFIGINNQFVAQKLNINDMPIF
jgi:hypothetical protein